jgi:protein SCO1/2
MCLTLAATACLAGEPLTKAAAQDELKISSTTLSLPDLSMIRQSGQAVSLASDMNDGRPVVLNFIFTSCEAICPMMTQTLAQFQELLGPERSHVHLMSISIDPEQDTPAQLRAYAKKFHAEEGWTFYTGTHDASISLQKAFNLYRGDKMRHSSVTFMRRAPGAPWTRLDGFASPDDLLREYKQVAASP